MAFSYSLLSSDAATVRIGKVRMELGDTVEDAGVLPDGSNLSDTEITVALTDAGNNVQVAVVALCGLLARRWATSADVTVGPRKENLSQVAKAWAERASAGFAVQSFVTGMVRSSE